MLGNILCFFPVLYKCFVPHFTAISPDRGLMWHKVSFWFWGNRWPNPGFPVSGCRFKVRWFWLFLWMISSRHTLPTPVLPLSVVAFLQPLFESEGIVYPQQETETPGKTDFDFDLLPSSFLLLFLIVFTANPATRLMFLFFLKANFKQSSNN